MSRFSNALALALRELRLTQKQFATQTNLTHSQVNRFVRGKNAGLGTLETLARHLPQPQRAAVVASWLRDALPQNAAVSISTPDKLTVEESETESSLLTDLQPDLERAFRFLINAARTHGEIMDLIIDLSNALQGERQRGRAATAADEAPSPYEKRVMRETLSPKQLAQQARTHVKYGAKKKSPPKK